jgi:hypothetical protein
MFERTAIDVLLKQTACSFGNIEFIQLISLAHKVK